MSRRAARFTEADAYRAIRAAQRANAGTVEIKPDGSIWIRISPSPTTEQATDEPPVRPKKRIVL
jgi:hypothetical protein